MCLEKQPLRHSHPQRPRSFWSAPRIATSGPVQRHSGFEWLCKHNRLRLEPIRFVRLDSEHAQSDGKSVNRGFLVLTKRSMASGDENAPHAKGPRGVRENIFHLFRSSASGKYNFYEIVLFYQTLGSKNRTSFYPLLTTRSTNLNILIHYYVSSTVF